MASEQPHGTSALANVFPPPPPPAYLAAADKVHRLITEATSHENLCQMYIGWMPWM